MAASKSPLVRLGHIRDEIDQLARALDGAKYEEFAASYVLRRTTQHAILIVSEAVKALSPTMTDPYAGIDWRAIRDIGNVLRHAYFEVDTQVLWRVASIHFPELKPVIDRMIDDLS